MARNKQDIAAKETNLPAELQHELLADSQEFDHGFTRQDLVLPFVRILQKLSPQLDKSESVYMHDANEGDFYNTATGAVIPGDEGIYFVPAVYTINYTEWTPRESGGGLVADHGPDSSCLEGTIREGGKIWTPDKTLISTAGLYFGYVVDIDTGDAEQVILPMASTQLKKSRNLNSLINNFRYSITTEDGEKRINPAMWFHVFKFTSVPESNDQGKWMGFKTERHSSVLDHPFGADLYVACKDLAEMYKKGEVKMRASDLDEADEKQGSNKDESVPF